MSLMVSALMVTQPRREAFEAQATADFMAQTYVPRELIVVRDPKDGTTLGELRNRAVMEARGEIVVVWDDDDRYDPHRIETQVYALGDGDLNFIDCLTLECRCGARVQSRVRDWECSMVARKARLVPYPKMNVGEDHAAVLAMADRTRSRISRPDLYTKVAHAGNTIDHKAILRNAGHRC